MNQDYYLLRELCAQPVRSRRPGGTSRPRICSMLSLLLLLLLGLKIMPCNACCHACLEQAVMGSADERLMRSYGRSHIRRARCGGSRAGGGRSISTIFFLIGCLAIRAAWIFLLAPAETYSGTSLGFRVLLGGRCHFEGRSIGCGLGRIGPWLQRE